MSADKVRLEPLGRVLEVERGTPLSDVLFAYGVEFPCGGRGRCRRCRVRVLEGGLAGEDALEPDGTHLACRCRTSGEVVLEIAQWESSILADDSPFEFVPREGYGVAVDLGTTTVVAQLLDLRTGRVLGVRTALNPQAAQGADIMTRIEHALHGGAAALEAAARQCVEGLISDLAPPEPPRRVSLVGNTAMHHLYCGLDVAPLAAYPFETAHDGPVDLGCGRRFLPCLGGFVGSDILAGILATGMHRAERLTVLMDLGTNGEIVVGDRRRLLCCSTAAGPAFEGGRISCGMRAATGAVSEVIAHDGRLECRVLGGGEPRGICGSGLVDAAAAALDLGWIQPNGRLSGGARTIPLTPSLALTQQDIRELQLAKGAMAAGLELLLERWGAAHADVDRVYLAGAFGNYLNRASARRIGLLDFPPDVVHPAGNTALLGAKLSLFQDGDYEGLRGLVEHVPLGADPAFQDRYVDAMAF